MKSYKFLNKQQAKTYSTFTIISVILAIIIFTNLDTFFNKSFAYLLVTIISSISIIFSIKQAGKGFTEIIIEDEKIKFFYLNKMKTPLILLKKEVKIDLDNDKIEFYNLVTNNFIGRAYKNRIVESMKWNKLIEDIDNI